MAIFYRRTALILSSEELIFSVIELNGFEDQRHHLHVNYKLGNVSRRIDIKSETDSRLAPSLSFVAFKRAINEFDFIVKSFKNGNLLVFDVEVCMKKKDLSWDHHFVRVYNSMSVYATHLFVCVCTCNFEVLRPGKNEKIFNFTSQKPENERMTAM